MVPRTIAPLSSLYDEDETAWLEVMSRLAAERRFDEFDCENLSEFLESMARRDRREVKGRLIVLLTHLLKWEHQPARRSRTWRVTFLTMRRELRADFESPTLRKYAVECLPDAYGEARKEAAAETDLPLATFPDETSLTLDDLAADDD